MAIYHCSIKIIGRSDGKSAVASSAYRSGEMRLRKAVSVALCIVSVTLALIAVKYIPMDINVVSWWISFSVGLNILYHGCCKINH